MRGVVAAVPLVAALPVGVLVTRAMTGGGGSPYALVAGAAVTLVVVAAVYGLLIRPRMNWQDPGAAKEARRQIVLHLTLITGSAIFLVPFAWLVVTSLKEDEDMSQFPPVWVPRQQVMVRIDGKEVGLATAPYRGVP